jgi:hypothetical protein
MQDEHGPNDPEVLVMRWWIPNTAAARRSRWGFVGAAPEERIAPEDALAARLARGEISGAEYEARLGVIEGRRPDPRVTQEA